MTEIIDRIKESDGFMTAKGALIDYSEWHAAAGGVAAMALHPAVSMALFTVALGGGKHTDHLKDIKEEIIYYVAGSALCAAAVELGLVGHLLSTELVMALL